MDYINSQIQIAEIKLNSAHDLPSEDYTWKSKHGLHQQLDY